MRFLVDACVPRLVADHLRSAGHDVVEASRRGPDPGDEGILASAVAEERVVVTMDKDLPELVFRGRREHRGVVRLVLMPPSTLIESVNALLADHSPEEISESICTLTRTRIRVARPPRTVE